MPHATEPYVGARVMREDRGRAVGGVVTAQRPDGRWTVRYDNGDEVNHQPAMFGTGLLRIVGASNAKPVAPAIAGTSQASQIDEALRRMLARNGA